MITTTNSVFLEWDKENGKQGHKRQSVHENSWAGGLWFFLYRWAGCHTVAICLLA